MRSHPSTTKYWQVTTMDLRPRLVECPNCGWIAVLDPKHMGNAINDVCPCPVHFNNYEPADT